MSYLELNSQWSLTLESSLMNLKISCCLCKKKYMWPSLTTLVYGYKCLYLYGYVMCPFSKTIVMNSPICPGNSPTVDHIYNTKYEFILWSRLQSQPEFQLLPYNIHAIFSPVRSFCLTGWYFSIWGSWLGNTIDDFLFFSTADCMTLLMLASREEVHSLLSLFSAIKMCCIFNNRFFCFKQVHLFSWNYNTTKSSLLHPSFF